MILFIISSYFMLSDDSYLTLFYLKWLLFSHCIALYNSILCQIISIGVQCNLLRKIFEKKPITYLSFLLFIFSYLFILYYILLFYFSLLNFFFLLFMSFFIPFLLNTATKQIRALGYTALILGVTGNSLPVDVDHFISHGANQVLIKPLDINDFKSAMKGEENK